LQLHLRKRYKHFKRYREIANVMAKHGFGHMLNQLGLAEFINATWNKYSHKPESFATSKARRLRLVLEELGPTFIKLGQLLSTRSDLLAADYIDELAKLQDEVPRFPFHTVKERVQMELGDNLDDIFLSFEKDPLAAASIGQVHRATLKTGEQVVVKVQRPGINATTEVDIEILYDLAALVDRHAPWGENYSVVEVVEEFDHMLQEELDFTREGKHIKTFRQNFANDSHIFAPSVNWEYTTGKILTMEYLEGIKLTKPELLNRQKIDKKAIARRLTDAMLRQIFMHGFFHADPHPGNLMVVQRGKIAFIDFGIVGRLDEEVRDKITNLVLGLVNRSTQDIIRAIVSLGAIPGSTDFNSLRRDIDRLRQKYYEIPLMDVSLSESLGDIMQITFDYNIRVPTEFTLLVKALITMEGIAAKLDPDLSIMEVVEPLGKELLTQRYSFKSVKKMLTENISEYHSIFTRLPKHLNQVLDIISSGELRFKTENPKQHIIITHLHKAAHKLSLSILTGSLALTCSQLAGKGVTLLGLEAENIVLSMTVLTMICLIVSLIRTKKL